MTPEQRLRRKIFRLVASVKLGEWRPGDVYFRTAQVLIAACFVGQAVEALETATGCSQDFIKRVSARARKTKIWRGATARAGWMAKDGDWAFILDVMVAAGDQVVRHTEAAPAKRVQQRRQLRAAGKCQCGREAPEGYKTCETCRAAVKKSTASAGERRARPMAIREADPRYVHVKWANKSDIPNVPAEKELKA